jgi:hypothetical protein
MNFPLLLFTLIVCEIKSDLWREKIPGKAYVSPVAPLASSGQTVLVEGSLFKSCGKTLGMIRMTRSQACEGEFQVN